MNHKTTSPPASRPSAAAAGRKRPPVLWTDRVSDDSANETTYAAPSAAVRRAEPARTVRTAAARPAAAQQPAVRQAAAPRQPEPPFAPPTHLGEQLVTAGLLTPEQVARVTEWQQRNHQRFGEAAITLGLLNRAQVQAALATQFQYSTALESHPTTARLPIANDPYGNEAEAIRQIRSELALRLNNPQQLSLAVISPNSNEGKSYLASSLAIAFAQAGKRTLLINANLRASGQTAFPGVDNATGLSSILAGHAPADPGQPFPGFPKLSFLNAGPQPPNPLEILQGLRKLLGALHQKFDVIILDTPPALRSADAQAIANQADVCLLVARKDVTLLQELNHTRQLLGTAGATVIGTVLNELPLKPRRASLLDRLRRFLNKRNSPPASSA